jgi:polyvinyl alcohol dehydrogenase (cytochrome)
VLKSSRISLRRVLLALCCGTLGCVLIAVPQARGAVRTGSSASQASAADQQPPSYQPATAGYWSSWLGDLSGSRFAAGETAITASDVSQLAPRWTFTFPMIPGVYPGSQPAVVGDTLFVGSTDAKLYALNSTTGAIRWSYDLTSVAGPWTDANPDPVRDGPAVAGGTVYFGDSRGYLYAVNQATGQLRWATLLDKSNPDVEITGSPTVYDGRVYVGVSNKEAGYQQYNLDYPCCKGRGELVALNAATGSVAWRHYTLPPAQAVGTWPSGATEYAPSGVSVWDTPVIDPASQTIFVGTGQNYTGVTSEADSVLALSLSNGTVRWQHQMQPDTYTSICDEPQYADYCPGAANGTDHDWDFGSSANLFTLDGRRVLGIGDKSGVYRAFDASTGQLLWSRALTPDPSVEGGSGGIQWGTSYDGNRLYVATWNANPGTLFALNPATGAIIWQTPTPADGCTTGGAGGQNCALAFTPAVTTSPGLVFEGNADGKMYAFSSATGNLLWQYDTVQNFNGVNGVAGHGESVSGLGGAVVANGMVYVQSGYYPISASTEGTVLLAFGLPGS